MSQTRRVSVVLLFIVVPACSLVLDEPAPFPASVADEIGADAAIRDAVPRARDVDIADAAATDADPPDAARPDASALDAAPDVAWDATPDVRPPDDVGPVDAGPVDAARPDAAWDATPDATWDATWDAAPDATWDAAPDVCVPGEEICNGVDDDCDGQIDEDDPRRCERCGPEGESGSCERGAWWCEDGTLRCVPWLPDPDSVLSCDGLDNDCDGVVDEDGEAVGAPTEAERAVRIACGLRPDGWLDPATVLDDCDVDPRIVGCAPVHACVDPACRATCLVGRDVARAACDERCDAAAEPNPEICRLACRNNADAAAEICLAACGEIDRGASRWLCEGGDGGPVCVALDCADGTRDDGGTCVPNVEICNRPPTRSPRAAGRARRRDRASRISRVCARPTTLQAAVRSYSPGCSS